MHQERARVIEAHIERERALINQANARSDLDLELKNACDDMKRLEQLLKDLEQTVVEQKRRARLEETSFQQGRASILEYTQALGDLNQFELLHFRSIAEHRQTAWKVLRLRGEVAGYLKNLAAVNK